MPLRRVTRLGTLIAAAILCYVSPVRADNYPSRPVHIVVPFAPGGATDALARALAQKMGEAWGQPVLVENRPGAAGNIGTEFVARAPADGYTILLTINSHAVNASLFPKLGYDPIKDFRPVSLFATAPNVLAANPSLPANTVPELIKLAKAKPGEITCGSAGSGSGSHLACALFANLAGVKITHVPYKGITPAVTDLMGGQISISFSVFSVVDPLVKAGKLKALAVTSLKRSPYAPDLPTVAESGMAGFDVVSWFGLLLPANTPDDVAAKVHDEVARVARLPDVKAVFAKQGIDLIGNTPAEFADFIKQDWAVWDKVIKTAGIKME
jgi:tripartite-type tricarboxylate transporter receptor subunit TctC